MMSRPTAWSPLLLAICFASAQAAQMPGNHPYYLHALTDLRSAYSLVQNRPGDMAVNGRESVARSEISDAINDIRKGAVDDGLNLSDHPDSDKVADHVGALHEAAELLAKAQDDVRKEEDDKNAKGLQQRSLDHIDRARTAVEKAITDVQEKK